MHLNVACWSRLLQKLPNITDKFSIEANSEDPEQSLIWLHTVCHRGFLNILAGE